MARTQGSNQQSFEAQRAAREQRLHEAEIRATSERERKVRDRSESVVLQARERLMQAAHRYHRHAREYARYDELDRQLRVEHDIKNDLRSFIAALVGGALMLLAIIGIDLALLAGAVHFLIGLVHHFPGGPPLLLMIVGALLVLAFELGLSFWIADAQEQADSGDASAEKRLRLLRILGGTLALVVPLMAAATLWTALDGANPEFSSVTPLLMGGALVLAGVVHYTVIFHGRLILDSLVRLFLAPRLWWVKLRIGFHDRRANAARDAARLASVAYETEYTRFNRTWVDDGALAIQARDVEIINEAVGDTVVAPPPAPPSPDTPPQTPEAPVDAPDPDGSNGHAGTSREPHITHPGGDGLSMPREEAASASPTADSSPVVDEADYYRRVMEAQRRDADGEIQP